MDIVVAAPLPKISQKKSTKESCPPKPSGVWITTDFKDGEWIHEWVPLR